jgi:CxxC motif-containing protein (DUF1111 family)
VQKHPSASVFVGAAAIGLLVLQVGIASQSSSSSSTTSRAIDPGVRGGTAGTGNPLSGLTANELQFFRAGKDEFDEIEDVPDGLGPRMNLDSCKGCHAQPASGGTSPALNPQVAFATANGGVDKVPSFLSASGPVREARFVRNKDGSADGGVHALFTITGRPWATGCSLLQPDFETEVANQNVIFRIPTPVFGAGLIEQIPDAAILANLQSSTALKSSVGISGRPNFHVAGRTVTGQTNKNGNDGTIARFGWKAQNKSLLMFSGEAYNVEMGISNDLFQTERDETAPCQYLGTPNSVSDMSTARLIDGMSAIDKFSAFMRFLAPPSPSPDTPGGADSIKSGRATFDSIGCAYCHTPSMKTGYSHVAALTNQTAALFSDLSLHDMGTGLADGVSQGEAGPREFRTAPLWGLGQRIFFLHDGRTSDLIAAIRAHQSTGSEANTVVSRFLNLTEAQKQTLLNFLRSL